MGNPNVLDCQLGTAIDELSAFFELIELYLGRQLGR